MGTVKGAACGALCAVLVTGAAWAQAPSLPAPASLAAGMPVHVAYALYAAGLEVAEVQMSYAIAPAAYRMEIGYHTVGIANLFSPGNNDSRIEGSWNGLRPLPKRLTGAGSGRGEPRRTDIDFSGAMPVVVDLLPADLPQRMPIPDSVKAGTVDTLSAMAALIRVVATTGSCDLSLKTYDGHRVLAFEAHAAGRERLGPYRASIFTGEALRCDFVGIPIGGAKIDDSSDARPLRGAAWFARPIEGGPPVPVRMGFDTRWFGEATMSMVSVTKVPDVVMVHGP